MREDFQHVANDVRDVDDKIDFVIDGKQFIFNQSPSLDSILSN
jgi:hypothetical protein